MKRLLTIGALCVALAGCGTTGIPLSFHSQAEVALLRAETAYHVAATAERDFCPDGVAKTAQCAKGDDLRHKGYAALLVARSAYSAGQSPSVATIAAITAELVALFPTKKVS